MNQNDTLLPAFFCVPDITGFTKLIATADINFSKEIIPSVLRRLIECNCLDLNIAEIEGDAIFFYRTGRIPSVKQIIKQCNLFFACFNKYIASLKDTHPEYYEKHLAEGQLGLKVIIHHGQVSPSNIKGRTKLIGKDVIIVHRLLKNSVPDNEYILLSENYLKKIAGKLTDYFNWDILQDGFEDYDYMGRVNYKYIKPKL